MTNIFNITDGSNSINMLNLGGIYCFDYREKLAQWKNGGVFANSPLRHGQFPVFRRYDNIVDTFNIYVVGASQDNAAATLRTLILLLEEGVRYWTEMVGTQAYIELKGDTESNTSYAEIYRWSIEEIPGRFGTPFELGGLSGGTRYASIIGPFQLTLEHGMWASAAPNSASDTPISCTMSYNSVTFGASSVSTQTACLSGKQTYCNLTHAYRYDDSATTYSSNIIGAALPYQLLPSNLAVGDCLYVGIQSSLSNSGPFHNVVFDIATLSGITGMAYEVWTGSWTSAGSAATDTTTMFTVAGVGAATIDGDASWVAVNLNTALGGSAPSVTAWWARFRVTSTGSTTPPTQQNRQIYTTFQSGVSVSAADISSSDLELPCSIYMGDEITRLAGASGGAYQVIVSRRSSSRGASFTPFLNASNTQLPSGVSVTRNDTSNLAFTTTPAHPAGNALVYTCPAGAGSSTGFYYLLDSTIAPQYVGKFRVFLRATSSAGPLTLRVRMHTISAVASSTPFFDSSKTFTGFSGSLLGQVVDFGLAYVPTVFTSIENSLYQLYITVSWDYVDASANTTFYDLILMPADESYCAYVRDVDYLVTELGLDSVFTSANHKYPNVGYKKRQSDGTVSKKYRANGSPIYLIPNTNQVLYFMKTFLSAGQQYCDPRDVYTISLDTRLTYHTPRGAN